MEATIALSIVCMAEDFLFHGLSKNLTESTVVINEGHVVTGPKLVVVGHLIKLSAIVRANILSSNCPFIVHVLARNFRE